MNCDLAVIDIFLFVINLVQVQVVLFYYIIFS